MTYNSKLILKIALLIIICPLSVLLSVFCFFGPNMLFGLPVLMLIMIVCAVRECSIYVYSGLLGFMLESFLLNAWAGFLEPGERGLINFVLLGFGMLGVLMLILSLYPRMFGVNKIPRWLNNFYRVSIVVGVVPLFFMGWVFVTSILMLMR